MGYIGENVNYADHGLILVVENVKQVNAKGLRGKGEDSNTWPVATSSVEYVENH